MRDVDHSGGVDPMKVECRATVCDDAPTFNLHWLNVLHLLGRNAEIFSILNRHKCLNLLFPFHLNAYVMGLRPL